MAVALRGQSSITSGSIGTGTTATAASPGSPVAGDFCLIWMAGHPATRSYTATGFTAVTVKQGNSQSCQLLYRAIDGTESWPITVTMSPSGVICGQCICYSGVNTASPFDPAVSSSGQTNASSTNVTPASITTTIASEKLVWFGATNSVATGGVPPTITVPSGSTPTWTAESSMTVTSNGTNINMGTIVADGVWSSSGAIQPIGTCTAALTSALTVGLQSGYAANGTTAAITYAAPSGAVNVTLPGVTATIAYAAPAGSVSVTLPGVTALTTYAAPSGTVSIASAAFPTAGITFTAPAGTVSVTIPGVTAPITYSALAGSVTTGSAPVTIPGAVSTVTIAAPTGAVSVTLPGVTGTIAFAASAGTVSITAPGTTARITVAAPAGTVSVVSSPQATAGVTFAAPAGKVSVTIDGAIATITIAALAGSITETIPLVYLFSNTTSGPLGVLLSNAVGIGVLSSNVVRNGGPQ